MSHQKKAAEILVEALIEEGVRDIFGYPGGAILPFFDVLYSCKEINFYLVRHEQAAGHAADGYARSSGRVGVCVTTSGPGATNLTTAIATAYMDSIPIIALTGQVPTTMIGNDAFQEADILGITRPIVKHSYLVMNPEGIYRIVKEAFYIARTGRNGPVVIDLPRDVTASVVKFDKKIDKINIRGYNPIYKPHPLQIKKTCELIKKSRRPVIYVGGGVVSSGSSEELKKLAELGNIPVTVTLLGLGAFDPDSELFLGMLGMHGTKYANLAVMNCDLIIAIGARFDDRATGKVDEFAPDAKIIHIDIDPASISKNIRVDIPIVGDAKLALQELLKNFQPPDTKDWLCDIKRWKEEFPLIYKKDDNLRPQYIIQTLSDITKGEAIITTEVGQNQMWAAQYYKVKKPRHFISSGGLGTMGFGFPAAIGAQIANPDKLVIDIAGDGSIQMNIQELATAVYYKLPVKIFILNNSYLGMVRQWQELFYNRRYSHVALTSPDYVKLADAYGAKGIRVTHKKDVKGAIHTALEYKKGPIIVDFQIEKEENVFPMVPAGAALHQMIGGMA